MTDAQVSRLLGHGGARRLVWLASAEAETSEAFRAKMIAATSRDEVRSTYRTGTAARVSSVRFGATPGAVPGAPARYPCR